MYTYPFLPSSFISFLLFHSSSLTYTPIQTSNRQLEEIIKCFENCDHTIDRVSIFKIDRRLVFAYADKTKHCRLCGSNRKHLFSLSSKTQKFKMKRSVSLTSSKASWFADRGSLILSSRVFLWVHKSPVTLPLFIRALAILNEDSPIWQQFTSLNDHNYLSKGLISKYNHFLNYIGARTST